MHSLTGILSSPCDDFYLLINSIVVFPTSLNNPLTAYAVDASLNVLALHRQSGLQWVQVTPL